MFAGILAFCISGYNKKNYLICIYDIFFKIDACLHFIFLALIKKKTNTCIKMEDNWSVVFGQFRLSKDPRLAGWWVADWLAQKCNAIHRVDFLPIYTLHSSLSISGKWWIMCLFTLWTHSTAIQADRRTAELMMYVTEKSVVSREFII